MQSNLKVEDVLVALNECNEPKNSNERLLEINKLRNSFNAQTCQIKLFDDSDEFLLRFLRSQRFDQDKALTFLNNYHTYFKNWPELFEKVKNPELIKYAFEAGCFIPLNGRALDGSIVAIDRPGRLENIDFIDYVAAVIISLNALLNEENNQIHGITWILDKKYLTFQLLQQLNPDVAKKFIDLFEGALPIKVRSINFVNDSKYFYAIFLIASLFISNRNRSLLTFHSINFASLQKLVDESVLPPEYGGKGPSIAVAAKRWKDLIFADASNSFNT